ncbi:DUF1176 domain-containing protein [Stappia sp. ES.058]|uniref:DUF1176 domain-containing protein n=1 Tax=Stappia sp. ES.058 TaxID=1881061 RepID=UPI00087DB700|nr:DUF1176 domain-containing protein [Stappia sp. ES.058]SDU29838.1 Protein of unknown function [Stappia sp. ES.058]
MTRGNDRRKTTLARWLGGAGVACALLAAAPPAFAAKDGETLDVRLFKTSDVAPPSACSLRLWQANRDPDTDRFAHVFLEDFGFDHTRTVARIRIGDEVPRLTRIAVGGEPTGYDLHPVQLYRSADGDTRVILDLTFAPEEGEAVEVETGKLTVIRQGFPPFRMTVKGGAGCMTPPAADPAPAADSGAGETDFSNLFRKYEVPTDDVPDTMIEALNRTYDCDWRASLARIGVTGYQTSEEGAIWEMGCSAGMHNAAYVYAQVYLFQPSEFSLMTFQNVKGHPRTSPNVLFNPVWNIAARTVASFTVDRGLGDCGTYERHRLVDARFEMVEYRAKPDCDGAAVEPETYPLIYRR